MGLHHGAHRPFYPETKAFGKPSGDKYSDGRALYLLVKEANKYWRMNYRFDGKHKTLAFGTYPEISLAEAGNFALMRASSCEPALIPGRRRLIRTRSDWRRTSIPLNRWRANGWRRWRPAAARAHRRRF
jgi:hypothetical protein